MSDKLYRYVLEVARQGSITAAANELYITPSALSKAIQKLEDDLGIPLFDRIGKSFSLTYAGAQYVRRAKEIISLQEQLDDEMRDLVALRGGRLRIGLQMDTAAQTVQAVDHFHREYPQIEVCILEDSSSNLTKMLLNGDVDIAIANADPDPQSSLTQYELCSSQLILAVPRNHPLVKRAVWEDSQKHPMISLSECMEESFILPPNTQRMGIFLEDVLRTRGLTPKALLRANRIGTILRLVSCGSGITITYDRTAEPYENSLNLTFLCFDHAPSQSLTISTCAGRYLSEAAQSFIRTCTDVFRD